MTVSIYIHKFLSYSITYYCTQYVSFYMTIYFTFAHISPLHIFSMQPHVPYVHIVTNLDTATTIQQFFHIALSFTCTNFNIIHSFFIPSLSLIHSVTLLSSFSSFSSLTYISLTSTFSQHHDSCSAASAFSQPNAEQLSYLFMAQLICKTQYWSHSFSLGRNVMSH